MTFLKKAALLVLLNISLVLAISDSEALTKYRLGWATGDTEIIMSVVNNASYTFTWLPNNNVVSARDFPQFFEGFKNSIVSVTNQKFFLVFDNMIQRKINGALYEAGDWIVDGFGRGTYFNIAKNGLVSWEIATQSQLQSQPQV